MNPPRPDGAVTSLDVLRSEDKLLRDPLRRLRADQDPLRVTDDRTRAASVDHRYRYGREAKEMLRRLAVRDSAAMLRGSSSPSTRRYSQRLSRSSRGVLAAGP